ncbi:MAG: hypothetical protein K2M17_06175, partial [Bacilli bacterium]|nr:hypothetical protein [Bacilli bacterium]
LLSEIQGGNVETTETFSPNEIKTRLEDFKRELMSIVSDEEFKQKMLPIIKFRQAQGHQYSFTNAILVYIQDPKATMVKSRTNWSKLNRIVVDTSHPIALWVPVGGRPLTDLQKEQITARFLNAMKVNSVKELNPGQKEELRVRLKPRGGSFKLIASFFDIRYTKQMNGKEDLVGNNNTDDIPWFDDSGEETKETKMYCDAVMQCIKDRGIKLNFVDDLGGARGVSKSGTIEVLSNTPYNSGLFNTLCHEYSHELLHQKYVVSADGDGYGRFFIGTQQGRAVVEQQAELSAWIVLRNFGFDMKTNINYVGLWGMDEKNACKVFDTVANVASTIIKDITEIINHKMNESRNIIKEELTGLDVAKMVGCEEIYLRSKEENENEGLNESKRQEFKKIFDETLKKLRKH